jgi:hypothetical protein
MEEIKTAAAPMAAKRLSMGASQRTPQAGTGPAKTFQIVFACGLGLE